MLPVHCTPQGGIFHLALSPSGALLVGIDGDGQLTLWDMPSGRMRKSWKLDSQPKIVESEETVFGDNSQARKDRGTVHTVCTVLYVLYVQYVHTVHISIHKHTLHVVVVDTLLFKSTNNNDTIRSLGLRVKAQMAKPLGRAYLARQKK